MVVSKYSTDVDCAYPTPSLQRDKGLKTIQPFFGQKWYLFKE